MGRVFLGLARGKAFVDYFFRLDHPDRRQVHVAEPFPDSQVVFLEQRAR